MHVFTEIQADYTSCAHALFGERAYYHAPVTTLVSLKNHGYQHGGTIVCYTPAALILLSIDEYDPASEDHSSMRNLRLLDKFLRYYHGGADEAAEKFARLVIATRCHETPKYAELQEKVQHWDVDHAVQCGAWEYNDHEYHGDLRAWEHDHSANALADLYHTLFEMIKFYFAVNNRFYTSS